MHRRCHAACLLHADIVGLKSVARIHMKNRNANQLGAVAKHSSLIFVSAEFTLVEYFCTPPSYLPQHQINFFLSLNSTKFGSIDSAICSSAFPAFHFLAFVQRRTKAARASCREFRCLLVFNGATLGECSWRVGVISHSATAEPLVTGMGVCGWLLVVGC